MAAALQAWYRQRRTRSLDSYSEKALRRVWRAQDFSNYMTGLLHDLGHGPYDRRLQLARLDYLSRAEAAARSLTENYAGLRRGQISKSANRRVLLLAIAV